MNIKEAKTEIGNTLRAYLRKDEEGHYCFPRVRQRPILLMGPPGIGKTAILEQVAAECGVGLVAYSLTHHTRQSAVGLPHIEKRTFHGQELPVTEYTMSEIIAAVYSYMARTGKEEGILFLDEVNCVSETLAPTMLQLLQNKTFGSHAIPEGWILVTAGNPPEYNKSVRDFDVATLDRVRSIPVEADCGVWLEYAADHGVHGAIRSYLAIRPEDFYLVEDTPEGKFFVTARGWEDLSEILLSYEALDIPVTGELVGQYLRKQEIASAFTAYYGLYRKYDRDYGIPEILDGTCQDREARVDMAKNGGFEERFTVVQLLMDCLEISFRRYGQWNEQLKALHAALVRLRGNWGEGPGAMAQGNRKSLKVKLDAGLADEHQAKLENWVCEQLEGYDLILKGEHIRENGFDRIRQLFGEQVQEFEALTEETSRKVHRAFAFAEDCFGEGQELVLLVTDLTRSREAMAFLTEKGSPDFLRHSDALLYRQQAESLQKQCLELLK